MTHTFRRTIVLLLAAGLAALATPLRAVAPQNELDGLFARYDLETDGPNRDRLAAQIDAVAHQKYATVSRLYWHTDLESAKAAAHDLGRPILHLRMLGRLDEELSCANSRLFRVTLYANHDVSRFLRERFILYWSSERPVPRVTIDFGDGRTLQRTTTGNSAHYVLDENGQVLDVLPGLYAPSAFLRELEGSLTLAARVRGASDSERSRLVVEYHREGAVAASRDWETLAGTPWIPGADQLLTRARIESPLAQAQRATFTKAVVELNDLRYFAKGLAPESLPEGQIEMWSAAGQVLYGIGDLKGARPQARVAPRGEPTQPRRQLPPPPRVLDEASRALVVRLHNGVPRELRASDSEIDAMVARLEQAMVADSALNQLRLRPRIAREIVRLGGRIEFGPLNRWIYAEVFRTPREDAWLGLLPRTMFTGLPGDGVVVH